MEWWQWLVAAACVVYLFPFIVTAAMMAVAGAVIAIASICAGLAGFSKWLAK